MNLRHINDLTLLGLVARAISPETTPSRALSGFETRGRAEAEGGA